MQRHVLGLQLLYLHTHLFDHHMASRVLGFQLLVLGEHNVNFLRTELGGGDRNERPEDL